MVSADGGRNHPRRHGECYSVYQLAGDFRIHSPCGVYFAFGKLSVCYCTGSGNRSGSLHIADNSEAFLEAFL